MSFEKDKDKSFGVVEARALKEVSFLIYNKLRNNKIINFKISIYNKKNKI